jgi:hypothetical protein
VPACMASGRLHSTSIACSFNAHYMIMECLTSFGPCKACCRLLSYTVYVPSPEGRARVPKARVSKGCQNLGQKSVGVTVQSSSCVCSKVLRWHARCAYPGQGRMHEQAHSASRLASIRIEDRNRCASDAEQPGTQLSTHYCQQRKGAFQHWHAHLQKQQRQPEPQSTPAQDACALRGRLGSSSAC